MNTTTGNIFNTPRGFIAKPEHGGPNTVRRFPTRGEAVAYLRRISDLMERVGR